MLAENKGRKTGDAQGPVVVISVLQAAGKEPSPESSRGRSDWRTFQPENFCAAPHVKARR